MAHIIKPGEPPYFQISIKGVIEVDGKIILLKNERDEWELPGGRMELHETPQEALRREVSEELNLSVSPTHLLNTWMYAITSDNHVFIVTYATSPLSTAAGYRISSEHSEMGFFGRHEIDSLNMPDGYKTSIAMYFEMKGVE